jgi:penicillin-binding protein 2
VRVSIWFENDKKLPQMRLAAVSYGIVALIGFLLFGFWNLQVIQTTHYADLAERNRIRSIPIIAPRGSILDRQGRVLVDNYPSFSVLLLRDAPKVMESLLPQIADGLGMTLADLHEQIDAAKSLPDFQPIVIKPEASPGDIAFIESHRPDIPVLEMMMVHRRRYGQDDFLAHAIGYVGEVSAEDIAASGGRLRSGDITGKSGLEKQYNDTLMGTDGLRRSIVNSVGKEVGQLSQQDPTPGKPIHLTIDYDLQSVAEQAMAGKMGAVVALDPRTGEVLAMVSHPSFNPNDFAVRIPRQEWDQLNNDPEKPLLDRSIQAQLAPGSVFKILETAAMLESKAIPSDFKVFCPGYATFYGRVFHELNPGDSAHGEVDLHTAIVKSCDIYFYNVGERLGIDRLSYYGTSFGLGRKTGVDLPGEDSGLMPSEAWKERVFHQKWYAGETISLAIGQGATEVTPMQMAYTIGGIISGGVFKQPHLLTSTEPAPEIDFPISEPTVDFITQAMYDVVNAGGTAAASKLPGIEFCGKTGTAQVISAAGKEKATNKSGLKNNAWFVGFAPRRNAEIVVAVLVQAGGYGAEAAAPVARDVVKAYYDKKGGTFKGAQEYSANPQEPATVPGSATATAQAAPATADSASRP